MALVIVFSNPFLFYEGPRNDMLAIQTYKTQELRYGYTHEESIYYRLGPQYWQWTVETSYGSVDFPLFLLALLVIGALAQPTDTNKWVLLAWLIPMGIYLMWFVSPKPDHYLLPLMLPLYATVAGTFDLLGRIAKRRTEVGALDGVRRRCAVGIFWCCTNSYGRSARPMPGIWISSVWDNNGGDHTPIFFKLTQRSVR